MGLWLETLQKFPATVYKIKVAVKKEKMSNYNNDNSYLDKLLTEVIQAYQTSKNISFVYRKYYFELKAIASILSESEQFITMYLDKDEKITLAHLLAAAGLLEIPHTSNIWNIQDINNKTPYHYALSYGKPPL